MALTGSAASPSNPALAAGLFARYRVHVCAASVALFVLALHLVLTHMSAYSATPLWGAELLFNILLNVAFLAISLAFGQRLAGPLTHCASSPIVDTLSVLALGFGALSLSILAIGLLHVLYWPVIAAAALALVAWLRSELLSLWCAVARGTWLCRLRAQAQSALSPGMKIPAIIVAGAILFAFLRNAVPLVGDEQDYDGVSYHVVAPKLYLAAHHIFPVPDIPLANAPSATEMFSILGLLAGTDMQMKVLNLCFSLLLGIAVFDFTRRHLRADAAALAVILLYLPLWIVNLMSCTLPDFAAAFFAVLSLDSMATWLERASGETSARENSPRTVWSGGRREWLLPRAGLLAGFAVSCKLTTAPLLPSAVLALGGACLTLECPGMLQRLRYAIGACLQVCVFAVLPLAPWFLKNVAFFGSPLYPVGQLVNGADCTGGVEVCAPAAAVASSPLPSIVQSVWHPLFNVVSTYWNYSGPLSACILIAACVFRSAPARFCVMFLLFGAVIWLKVEPLFNPPRYWLPMLCISFCLSSAAINWTLEQLGSRLRWTLRLFGEPHGIGEVVLVMYLAIASLWLLIISIGLAQRASAFDLLSGGLSRHEFLVQRVRPYSAMDWVNAHVGSTTEVVTVNTSLGYYLQEPYLSDWFGTRSARLQAGGTQRKAEFSEWCAANVRAVVLNRGLHEYNSDSAAEIQPRASIAWLRTPGLGARLLFTWRGVDVIAVHPCDTLSRPR